MVIHVLSKDGAFIVVKDGKKFAQESIAKSVAEVIKSLCVEDQNRGSIDLKFIPNGSAGSYEPITPKQRIVIMTAMKNFQMKLTYPLTLDQIRSF